jgi:hypothetical protein
LVELSEFPLGGEVLVQESYAHGSLSSGRGDAFGRIASYVTDREDAGKRGLERQA